VPSIRIRPATNLGKSRLGLNYRKKTKPRLAKLGPQGYVNISIGEEGDVIDAKVVQASSPEAVDLLLTFAKTAKFKPRQGCGITHGAINYTLANQ
jgi:outer membrane biosynthesis protein TonB